MRRFLLKIGLHVLLLFVVVNLIAFLSLYFLGKSYFYKPQFVTNGVAESHLDYVVLGSSTGLTTLDTKLMDSLSGKKGLNISMDDSSLSSHYLMLEYFYSIGKKTDRLVLAVTPWDLANEKPVLNNNDYRFLTYIRNECVYDYYRNIEEDNFKKLSLSRYFPIIGVSYYNTELFYPSLVALIKPQKRNQFDDRGNYSYPNQGNPKKEKAKTVSLEFKNPYFDKILAFCKTKKIELVLYQSPMYGTAVMSQNKGFQIINHSDLFQSSEFFYDHIHVNAKGRKICSTDVSEILNNMEVQ